ncbi:hypothetical protein Hanom_Chr14g01258331 [Helianthus anomalus]
MNIDGCKMSEIRETRVDFNAFGDGKVSKKAMAASAATTYVRIIHCNAIGVRSIVMD